MFVISILLYSKYLSTVDFYAKFLHVIKVPIYSEEFRSVSEEILNIMKLFSRYGMSCRETALPSSDIRYGAEIAKKSRNNVLISGTKRSTVLGVDLLPYTKKITTSHTRYGQMNSFFKLNLMNQFYKIY